VTPRPSVYDSSIGVELRANRRIGDGADLQRGEPGGDELGTVGQNDEHAIARPDPKSGQSVAETVDHRLQAGICEGPVVTDHRDALATAFDDVTIEEILREVESLGNRRHPPYLPMSGPSTWSNSVSLQEPIFTLRRSVQRSTCSTEPPESTRESGPSVSNSSMSASV